MRRRTSMTFLATRGHLFGYTKGWGDGRFLIFSAFSREVSVAGGLGFVSFFVIKSSSRCARINCKTRRWNTSGTYSTWFRIVQASVCQPKEYRRDRKARTPGVRRPNGWIWCFGFERGCDGVIMSGDIFLRSLVCDTFLIAAHGRDNPENPQVALTSGRHFLWCRALISWGVLCPCWHGYVVDMDMMKSLVQWEGP